MGYALAVSASFEIQSSVGDGRLVIERQMVRLTVSDLAAKVAPYEDQARGPLSGLGRFVEELAVDWMGWDGARLGHHGGRGSACLRFTIDSAPSSCGSLSKGHTLRRQDPGVRQPRSISMRVLCRRSHGAWPLSSSEFSQRWGWWRTEAERCPCVAAGSGAVAGVAEP